MNTGSHNTRLVFYTLLFLLVVGAASAQTQSITIDTVFTDISAMMVHRRNF